MIMFDVDAIMEDPTLNTLTWEIIEARGIKTGDLMALWDAAVSLGESCAHCALTAEIWATPVDDDDIPSDVEMDIVVTYEFAANFFARESRELIKFLKLRGFEFPEGRTGKRPPDAIGF